MDSQNGNESRDLAARVARLEREARLWRRSAALVGAGLGLFGLLGGATSSPGSLSATDLTVGSPGQARVRITPTSVALLDDAGVKRVELELKGDFAAVGLRDAKDSARVALVAEATDSKLDVRANDASGVFLLASPSTWTGATVFDSGARARAGMQLDTKGRASFYVNGSDGKELFNAPLSESAD
jgi:hypothetical protein